MLASLVGFRDKFPEAAKHPEVYNQTFKLMWFSVGSADPGIADWLRQTDRDLSALGLHHSFTETEGAHDYAVWRWSLVHFVPLLFQK